MLQPLSSSHVATYRQKTHSIRQRTGDNANPLTKLPKVHINIHNGRINISGYGHWYNYWRDPYHLLLTVPWLGFLGLVSAGYVAINVCFALAFLAGGDCIANAAPGSFGDAFFFSVQTLGAIGYGVMSPTTTYANTLVAVEGLISILSIALMTGLAFARFAQPTARVLFSRVAVINRHNGVPTLTFRAANQRQNQILEAQTRVYFMRDEISAEGEFMRRFYDLKLVRDVTPAFSLPWTIRHPIDEDSPLYGLTPESLVKTNATLMVSLTGIDETVAQSLYARRSYTAQELVWNHRFIDLMHEAPNGDRYIDYNHFHDVTAEDYDID